MCLYLTTKEKSEQTFVQLINTTYMKLDEHLGSRRPKQACIITRLTLRIDRHPYPYLTPFLDVCMLQCMYVCMYLCVRLSVTCIFQNIFYIRQIKSNRFMRKYHYLELFLFR